MWDGAGLEVASYRLLDDRPAHGSMRDMCARARARVCVCVRVCLVRSHHHLKSASGRHVLCCTYK